MDELNLLTDLSEQISATSEALYAQVQGSDERMTEAKVYDIQTKAMMQLQKQVAEQDLESKRLEIESKKLDIEMAKANNEKVASWTKVGLTALALCAEIGTGILYLKANLKYGGMLGKDAQNWFRELKRIKL